MSRTPSGVRLLRAGIGVVVAFVVVVGGYITWAAVANPDVRLKPQWLPEGQSFDHSYWLPFWVVAIGGAGLVALVLWKALRRMQQGEDLYEGRIGRGLRRRGERFVEDDEAA